jgi:3D (Asp-Asp-Asp) domain-containing protein
MDIIVKNVKSSLAYLFIALVCTVLGIYMLLQEPVQTPVSVKQKPIESQQAKSKVATSKQETPDTKQAGKLKEAERFPLAWKGETVETLATLTQYPKVNVVATGYSPGPESTGKDVGHPAYGITYSGVKARRDTFSTIAADLKIFPLGTILYIPGYGYGVVADIGSAIKGKKIDLYFDTKEHVYEQWGKKKLDVYVIERGKGKVDETVFHQLNQMVAREATKQ